MAKVARISISLEGELLGQLDRAAVEDGYPTRSEAVKAFIRGALVEKEWKDGGKVAGAVVSVYDHHRRNLVGRLVGIQHDFGDVIISTQHVHLDHHNCLEIAVVRGDVRRIRRLVAGLRSIKGIKHSALVATTTGSGIA